MLDLKYNFKNIKEILNFKIFYSVIIIYDFVLSVYVIFKANSPIGNFVSQFRTRVARAATVYSAIVFGYR